MSAPSSNHPYPEHPRHLLDPVDYSLFRLSTLGKCLTDALDALVDGGQLTFETSAKIMRNFDNAMARVLKDKSQGSIIVKGELDSYRLCNDQWTFLVKNISAGFRENEESCGQYEEAKKLRIIAVPSATARALNRPP